MLSTLTAAVGLFAGTNIDDIVVVTLFFVAVQRGSLKTWHVVVGQYLGVGALVALSVLAALGLTIVPDDKVRLLGLVPLALGVWGFVTYARSRTSATADEPRSPASANGLLGVTAVTLANGADNIAVYTPWFRTSSTAETIATIIVFAVLIGVWLAAAKLVGSHPKVLQRIENVEGWLVPGVFVALGTFILLDGP